MDDELKLPRMSLSEFKGGAMQRYMEVFASPCSLISPFTPEMDSRLVIFNEMHSVDTSFLLSIISDSKGMGDTGFYFSFVEVYDYQIWYPGMPNDEKYLKSWFVPFDDVKDYLAQTFLTNHVIYSQQGKWGVFVSVDHFLILGGISSFVSQIISKNPDLDQATDRFIRIWKEWNLSLGYRLEWITDLLKHVYGIDKAKKLVQKHALPES